MKKERNFCMKKFEVTLTGHYEKTISVYAESPEQAAEKVQIVLFDTDLIDFSDEDFAYGEADIKEADEDGCCSDCPYFCPMCGECMYEDED
jgi:hypothetical protein